MNKVLLRRLAYIVTAIVAVIVAVVVIVGIVHRLENRDLGTRMVTVTVIPGSTINTIAKSLSRLGLPSQSFLKLALPTFGSSTTTSGTQPGLEGYLYPDTYYFASDESADRIVKTMVANFDIHFPRDLFDNQRGTVRSRDDIVIMASILEKEVAKEEDRRIVSGILWKRLDERLPLGVDSTVHYFLVPPKGVVYNTYQDTGLPIRPISNPSLDSIRAALEPKATDYWYFLSAHDGTTVYSRTLGEHLINKAKYIE
ncbi:MAG: endolytic transglycosylase MltG [Candidatus Taylorbacteria bacterium]|nr:endolytic transglycosylase MltG [Candidatus Taylorbacteria bacterium]